jgi:hypothetical protein
VLTASRKQDEIISTNSSMQGASMSDLSRQPGEYLIIDIVYEALCTKDKKLHALVIEAASRNKAVDWVGRLARDVANGKRPANQRLQMLRSIQELGGPTRKDHLGELGVVCYRDTSPAVTSLARVLLADNCVNLAFASARSVAT